MRFTKRGMLATFCLIALASCDVPPEQSDAGDIEVIDNNVAIDPDKLIIATATQYWLDFKSNAVAALDRYSAQPFVLKGEVRNVETSSILEIDHKFVKLDPTVNADVNLSVDATYEYVWTIINDSALAHSLKPGDRVILICRKVADIPLHSPAMCADAHSATWDDPELAKRVLRPDS